MNTTSSDLIDSKLEEHQLCASRQCPRCGHKLSKRDWGGLPAGVKFDPTDQELIEHLEAKVGGGGDGGEGIQESNNKAAHPLIDKFIPTLDGEDGICYTHPEKLPGVTRDGLSRHFFHRPSKAYTTGTRKRRKIQTESDTIQGSTSVGETRWHKTGKTRPVMVNGRQKGCKKILVLYTNFGKNRKPEKTNWVMHQYHLGQNEEEKEGELVVSKIFYQTQPRQCNWSSALEKSVSLSAAASVEGSGEASGSVCSKVAAADEVVVVGGGEMGYNSHHALEYHQQFKTDPFGYVSFSKGFDEAGIGGGGTESGVLADPMPSMSAAMCDPGHHHEVPSHHLAQHDQHYQHHHNHHQPHQTATASFHISRPTHPISQIISPPLLHHASIILDDHSSFHAPRIILPNDNFQQQQQTQQQTEQQQHDKIGGRSSSGLEEIIRGCTSSSSADLKEESSMTNPQEAEWLKYSTFWQDPDNPNHHG